MPTEAAVYASPDREGGTRAPLSLPEIALWRVRALQGPRGIAIAAFAGSVVGSRDRAWAFLVAEGP